MYTQYPPDKLNQFFNVFSLFTVKLQLCSGCFDAFKVEKQISATFPDISDRRSTFCATPGQASLPQQQQSAVQTVIAAATTTTSPRLLDSGCTDSRLLHTRMFSHVTGANWSRVGSLDNKSDCSVFLWLIYDVVRSQNLRHGHISAGVIPLISSDNVGRRPSKPPAGKSVGSTAIVLSLFIV